jgi:hypothetical protein
MCRCNGVTSVTGHILQGERAVAAGIRGGAGPAPLQTSMFGLDDQP